MPARRLSERMSPDEIVAHQRERNRKKQKAFKDRQKAARIATQLELDWQNRPHPEEPARRSRPPPRSPMLVTSPSGAPTASPLVPRTPSNPPAYEASPWPSPWPSLCDGQPWQVESSDDGRPGAGDRRTTVSSIVPSRSGSSARSPISLFGSLLNDTLPIRLVPDPRATSFLPRTLNVNLLRQSLGLPHHPAPAGCLPSFTYESPVDHDHPCPPNNSSWKVALFEFHTAMVANRAHPLSGFLHNLDSRKATSEAQLLISQLLFATSDQRALFDRPQVLAPEDADFLTNTTLDARVALCPDPLARLRLAQVFSKIDLTEMQGLVLERSRIYGDVYDAGSTSIPDDFCDSLRPDQLGPNGHRTEAGRHLRGASVREIVLGLEEPGWRNTAPVFPPFELAHWDHMEEIYELTTHGPRRREATLIEIDEDSARPV